METIRIVSTGGVSIDTQVYGSDGVAIKGVTNLCLTFPIDGPVLARISIGMAGVDVEAHPLLSIETLMEAAEHYGLELVDKKWKP